MSKKHKVKSHRWIAGLLHVTEHLFESLEEALHFCNNTDGHALKIYNGNDQLVHQINNQTVDTYA